MCLKKNILTNRFIKREIISTQKKYKKWGCKNSPQNKNHFNLLYSASVTGSSHSLEVSSPSTSTAI